MYRQKVRQLNELKSLSGDLHRYLCACGEYCSDTVFDVKLVVFELAGNVLQHSRQPAEVTVDLDQTSVYVNIRGGNSFDCERNSLPDEYGERGRGLYLVRSISEKLEYQQDGRFVKAVIARKHY
jgi:hypothetical protein